MTELKPYCQGAEWTPRKSAKEEGTCGACGKALEGRNLWFCRTPAGEQYGDSCRARYAINHFWDEARRAAIKRDDLTCVKCGFQSGHSGHGLEVNHIIPRDGAGYGPGCHHHQDNLLSVCHACHLLITAEERGYVPGGKQQAAQVRRQERDQEKLRRWHEVAGVPLPGPDYLEGMYLLATGDLNAEDLEGLPRSESENGHPVEGLSLAQAQKPECYRSGDPEEGPSRQSMEHVFEPPEVRPHFPRLGPVSPASSSPYPG